MFRQQAQQQQTDHAIHKDLCSLTIFNMIAKSDLQNAFDRISSLISSSSSSSNAVAIIGSIKNHPNLTLNISILASENYNINKGKYFLVTILPRVAQRQHILSTPQQQQQQQQVLVSAEKSKQNPNTTLVAAFPTYTTG